jgi:lysophospholipase L1-like esterase
MDVPHWTNDLRQAFHATQFPPSFAERMSWIPMFRLVDFSNDAGEEQNQRCVRFPTHRPHTEKHIHTAINGFRQSRDISRAIAGLYDVPTLFFLQPNAFYNYDLKLYRLTTIPEWFLEYRRFMKPVYDQLKSDRAYIDLSGMLDEWGHRKAMIDDVHYSPAFNQFLAERVSQSIDVQALQPRSSSEDSATGASR